MSDQNKNIQERLKHEIEKSGLPQDFFDRLQKDSDISPQALFLAVCYGNAFSSNSMQKIGEGVAKMKIITKLSSEEQDTLYPVTANALRTSEVDATLLYKELETIPVAEADMSSLFFEKTTTASTNSIAKRIEDAHDSFFTDVLEADDDLINNKPSYEEIMNGLIQQELSTTSDDSKNNKFRIRAAAAAAAANSPEDSHLLSESLVQQNSFPKQAAGTQEEVSTDKREQPQDRYIESMNRTTPPSREKQYNTAQTDTNETEQSGEDAADNTLQPTSPFKLQKKMVPWLVAGAGGAFTAGAGGLAFLVSTAATDKPAQTTLAILKLIACTTPFLS